MRLCLDVLKNYIVEYEDKVWTIDDVACQPLNDCYFHHIYLKSFDEIPQIEHVSAKQENWKTIDAVFKSMGLEKVITITV